MFTTTSPAALIKLLGPSNVKPEGLRNMATIESDPAMKERSLVEAERRYERDVKAINDVQWVGRRGLDGAEFLYFNLPSCDRDVLVQL